MKADMNSTTDELPSFFDENGPTTDDSAVEATDAGALAEGELLDTGDEQPADDESQAAAPAPRTSHARRREAARAKDRPAGTLGIAVGAIFLAFAVGLALAGQGIANLAQFGVEPSTLLVLGVVMGAAGFTRRRIGTFYERFEESQRDREQMTQDLTESLQFLVASQHATNERPPVAGEELQHVMVAMQRADEKITNLTKAIKMYGKPLMEISGQATEIAGNVGLVRTAVEGGTETARQGLIRLEQQVRTSGVSKQDLAELQAAIAKLGNSVATIEKQGQNGKSLEPMQQSVARVEVAVQAMAQRLEDTELRKSMLRLEDTAHKMHDQVQQLLRGESLQKATKELQAGLEGATKRLGDSLKELREGNLGGLESSVREIQREIAGVATSVAQIQNSVKGGVRSAAPTPAPAAPQATVAPAATAPAQEPAAPTAPAGGGGAASADGYQTGKRSTPGKNVLGAIAKLKQMKN